MPWHRSGLRLGLITEQQAGNSTQRSSHSLRWAHSLISTQRRATAKQLEHTVRRGTIWESRCTLKSQMKLPVPPHSGKRIPV